MTAGAISVIGEQLRLFDVPRCRCGDPRCVDCDLDTAKAHEVYMVRDDVWPLGALDGVLCVGCVEERIGRRLTPADFIDVPINHCAGSERLRSRQGWTA